MENQLWFGDNLEVLRRHVPAGTVGLAYLDPPFNSNAEYNVLFKSPRRDVEDAQVSAFHDFWNWESSAEGAYDHIMQEIGGDTATIVRALRGSLGESDMMAYLVMMAVRLHELRRVLKPDGSLYLHCDPTASHYLKVLLDRIFGPPMFRNEISWRRSYAHNDAKQGRRNVRGVILFYSKHQNTWTWNWQYTLYDSSYLQSEYKHSGAEGAYKETDLTAAKPGGDTSFVWRVKRKQGSGERWQPDLEDEYLRPREGWEYHGVSPYRGRFWAYSRKNMIEFWEQGLLVHRSTGMPRLIQYADRMPGGSTPERLVGHQAGER